MLRAFCAGHVASRWSLARYKNPQPAPAQQATPTCTSILFFFATMDPKSPTPLATVPPSIGQPGCLVVPLPSAGAHCGSTSDVLREYLLGMGSIQHVQQRADP
ncbi:hypothetical protein QC761_0071430 [Podospora bellae-mahoneyi]|uniref:Uncharacterized protein n=1 Tax=Podospora bellae-mahoneyi TaxID=2093777 RepID=A0ABR0FL76_9PEZI|nr:hypothetical protein QC761_0071430 [Podospora bellae-mahoneyi]